MTNATGGAITYNATRDKGIQLIQRDVLQDKRLSFRARGILAYLLSLPDGWRTSAAQLSKELKAAESADAKAKEGREAVERALRELVTVGYLGRERVQGAGGTWSTVWIYGDDPAVVAEAVAAEVAKRRRSLNSA
jgi:hypothetical protein